ncbi:tetratricopeptide repeat protein, partial [Salmonella enterica]|uniref:tetratricopeptide repeat protein n=1 Tax=Salmonella enterica TaxID=28901 RepID=UPI003CEC5AF2
DAQALLTQGQQAEALQRLQQAVTTAPQAARPRLEHAQLQHRMGQSAQALHTFESLAEQSPASLPLAAQLLVDIAAATGQRQHI